MSDKASVKKAKVFRSSEFVNRAEDVALIEKMINENKKGVFIFEGDKGSGKTTLLFEIYRRLSLQTNLKPFLLSLFSYSAPEFDDASCWVKERDFATTDIPDVMKAITQHLKVDNLDQSAPEELKKDYLARNLVYRNPSDPIPVLLVDSIYECKEEVRNEIENSILTPLLASERVFIILSGRGNQPIWSRPEIQNAEFRMLSSLEESHVREFLDKIYSPYLEDYKEIYRLSLGYPLIVRLMGSTEKKSDKSLQAALSDAIDIIIQDALPEEEKKDQKQYLELRTKIEKLSLVGIDFREADIQDYLYPYLEEGQSDKRDKTRKLFNILLQSNLLRYEAKGYQLNRSISRPIKILLKEDPTTSKYDEYFRELEAVSKRLQEDFPSAREWYRGMASA